jgi:hypothetical protein
LKRQSSTLQSAESEHAIQSLIKLRSFGAFQTAFKCAFALTFKFMAFLAPFTLLGLLLVSLPVLIHLLVRRRGRRLDFPSLKYLRETPSFKLYPRRIRQPLLLALRAAAIILFVLGLARPLLTTRAHAPEAVRFILMDASLSMKTGGRVEAAREQARGIVNKLQKEERAAVIALSSEAVWLTELTGDRERLLEAIARYEPTGGAIDYDAGFAEIGRRLRTEPQVAAEADIISDFQQSGLEGRAPVNLREAASFSTATYPVGDRVERNSFLTGEALGRTKRGLELSASEIISEKDGRSAARRAWAIDEREGERSGIEWRTEANNQLTGRLTVIEADDFDADDERYFAFTAPRENRILLVEGETDASLYLRAALEADAGGEGTTRHILDSLPRLPESAADLASYSLVVVTLHGTAQEREADALIEYARAGGTVWIFLARDLDTVSWSQLASVRAKGALGFENIGRRTGNQPLRFGAMDRAAPQLRGLDESSRSALSAVRVSESYLLTPDASSDVLIRWSDGAPAFISKRVGRGLIMLLATSIDRASGELVLSPAFPALVSSVLNAASAPSEPLSQTIGEAVRLDIAPEAEVKIRDTKGRVVVAKGRELVRRPIVYFKEPGIYRLEFERREKFLAFNAPVAESERALATTEELKRRFAASEVKKAGALTLSNAREATERSGSIWRYFLGAAFLLMIAEVFVALWQRKGLEG